MKIRFAADLPFLSPLVIQEDWEEYYPGRFQEDAFTHGGVEEPPAEGTAVTVWRVFLDREFLDEWEPIMDLSWMPFGTSGTIAIDYTDEGAEFTFANKVTAEEFVARVNRLLRSSLHGWHGGDPSLED